MTFIVVRGTTTGTAANLGAVAKTVKSTGILGEGSSPTVSSTVVSGRSSSGTVSFIAVVHSTVAISPVLVT